MLTKKIKRMSTNSILIKVIKNNAVPEIINIDKPFANTGN